MTRILIADDSPPIRKGLRNLLESHSGWEICGEAVNGRDAVQKSRQLTPDLVVIDFVMPEMNGCEAAGEISRLFPRVPILLLTMYLSQPLLELARRVGIRGAVSKTDILQVVSGVEALLRNKDFFCFAN